MKLHGHKGGLASHGNSLSHRTIGSIGILGPCKVGWSPLYSFLVFVHIENRLD